MIWASGILVQDGNLRQRCKMSAIPAMDNMK